MSQTKQNLASSDRVHVVILNGRPRRFCLFVAFNVDPVAALRFATGSALRSLRSHQLPLVAFDF